VLAAQRRLGLAWTASLAILLAAYPLLVGGAGEPRGVLYLSLASFFFTGSLLYAWGHLLDRYRALFLPVAVAGAPIVLAGSPWLMPVPIVAQIVVGLWVYCVAFASRTIVIRNDVSYGAYLLHFPTIQLGLVHGLLVGGWLAIAPKVLLATTALAWLSFRCLERPMINLGHRLSPE
jgi:peptidoglycan/LPS O-acetylase OafA/YrhL